MIKLAFTTLSLLVTAVLAAACSSGELTLDEFTDEYCDRAANCCSANGPKDDGQQCRSLFALVSAFGGTDTFRPEKARECLDAVDALAKENSTWCQQSELKSPACDELFGQSGGGEAGGDKQPGAKCSFSSECSSAGAKGALCDYSSGVSVCVIYDVASVGAACDADLDEGAILYHTSASSSPDLPELPARPALCDNAAGLTCDSNTRVCAAFAQVGDDCSSRACVESASCGYSSRVCEALGAPGDSCARTRCVTSAYCGSDDQMCHAEKAAGEACDGSDECAGFCDEGVCDGNDGNDGTGGGGFGLCAAP